MIEEIKNYLKTKTDQFEIYYSENKSIQGNVNKAEIDNFVESHESGLGIRVVKNKKLGFATTTNLKNFKQCCDNAIKIANINDKDNDFVSFVSGSKHKPENDINKELLNWNIGDIQTYLKECLKITKNNGIKCTSAIYQKTSNNRKIVNSEGVDVEVNSCFNSFGFEMFNIKDGTSHYGGYESKNLLGFFELKKHIERLRSMKNKNTPKTCNVQLLLHPEALSELISNALINNLIATNVQNKRSVFVGKINKIIFDKKLTIIDDATNKKYNYSRKFDSEGTATKELTLIKNGRLKSFFHNSYTAHKENKKSTGHASRSYSSIPTISSSNVIMQNGNKDINKLISNIKNGIYIKSLMGLHTMNSQTGDFSLGTPEAHFIKNGEIKYAVKDTMIAGNVFNLLKNIDEIGKEVVYAGGGYYLPNVLFSDIKVIGN